MSQAALTEQRITEAQSTRRRLRVYIDTVIARSITTFDI